MFRALAAWQRTLVSLADVAVYADVLVAPRLDVDEVEVVLQIETRGPEHCGEVIGALRAAGYTLAFG